MPEKHHWTLRVSQVPNLELAVLLIVVAHCDLGGDLWVPCEGDVPVIRDGTILEVKNGLICFEVPDHCEAI